MKCVNRYCETPETCPGCWRVIDMARGTAQNEPVPVPYGSSADEVEEVEPEAE